MNLNNKIQEQNSTEKFEPLSLTSTNSSASNTSAPRSKPPTPATDPITHLTTPPSIALTTPITTAPLSPTTTTSTTTKTFLDEKEYEEKYATESKIVFDKEFQLSDKKEEEPKGDQPLLENGTDIQRSKENVDDDDDDEDDVIIEDEILVLQHILEDSFEAEEGKEEDGVGVVEDNGNDANDDDDDDDDDDCEIIEEKSGEISNGDNENEEGHPNDFDVVSPRDDEVNDDDDDVTIENGCVENDDDDNNNNNNSQEESKRIDNESLCEILREDDGGDSAILEVREFELREDGNAEEDENGTGRGDDDDDDNNDGNTNMINTKTNKTNEDSSDLICLGYKNEDRSSDGCSSGCDEPLSCPECNDSLCEEDASDSEVEILDSFPRPGPRSSRKRKRSSSQSLPQRRNYSSRNFSSGRDSPLGRPSNSDSDSSSSPPSRRNSGDWWRSEDDGDEDRRRFRRRLGFFDVEKTVRKKESIRRATPGEETLEETREKLSRKTFVDEDGFTRLVKETFTTVRRRLREKRRQKRREETREREKRKDTKERENFEERKDMKEREEREESKDMKERKESEERKDTKEREERKDTKEREEIKDTKEREKRKDTKERNERIERKAAIEREESRKLDSRFRLRGRRDPVPSGVDLRRCSVPLADIASQSSKPCYVRLVDFVNSRSRNNGGRDADALAAIAAADASRRQRKESFQRRRLLRMNKAQLRKVVRSKKAGLSVVGFPTRPEDLFSSWQLREAEGEVRVGPTGSVRSRPTPVPRKWRRPLRVLSLFDGISTALVALKALNLRVDTYLASEIDPTAIQCSSLNHPEIVQVGDARDISEDDLRAWGPFDLVVGGSPCNDFSRANPLREGFTGKNGKLFFEFARVLNICRSIHEEAESSTGDSEDIPRCPPPMFWLFENVVMDTEDRSTISFALESDPVIVDAVYFSPMKRSRLFWSNIPWPNTLVTDEEDVLTLQNVLERDRVARVVKIRCITTKSNSLYQGKFQQLPVHTRSGREAPLTTREIERCFGFEDDYTGGFSEDVRQQLLGMSWSVPCVKKLFRPLKDYFAAAEEEDEVEIIGWRKRKWRREESGGNGGGNGKEEGKEEDVSGEKLIEEDDGVCGAGEGDHLSREDGGEGRDVGEDDLVTMDENRNLEEVDVGEGGCGIEGEEEREKRDIGEKTELMIKENLEETNIMEVKMKELTKEMKKGHAEEKRLENEKLKEEMEEESERKTENASKGIDNEFVKQKLKSEVKCENETKMEKNVDDKNEKTLEKEVEVENKIENQMEKTNMKTKEEKKEVKEVNEMEKEVKKLMQIMMMKIVNQNEICEEMEVKILK